MQAIVFIYASCLATTMCDKHQEFNVALFYFFLLWANLSQYLLDWFWRFFHQIEGICTNFLDPVQFFRFHKGRSHSNQFCVVSKTQTMCDFCKLINAGALWSVSLHNGRMSVRPANFPCPTLDLQPMGDHCCGWIDCYRSVNQANSAFHRFMVNK